MLDYITDQAVSMGFVDADISKIQMASEEILTNVIKYAYVEDNGGDVEITCQETRDKLLEIVIKDMGVPFNPLEDSAEVDVNASLEERRIGGLGVMMVQHMMDDISYKRDQNYNVFTMKKRFSQELNGSS
jgi:anti-sigma regulatory factor (Ser/Thr protein kinase)